MGTHSKLQVDRMLAELLLLSITPESLAAPIQTASEAGLAGAGLVHPIDGGVVDRCPAAVSLSPLYLGQVDLNYRDGFGLRASLQDSRTSALGLGLSYARRSDLYEPGREELPGWITPGLDTSAQRVQQVAHGGLSVSTQLGQETVLAMGLGGAWSGEVVAEEFRGSDWDSLVSAALKAGPVQAAFAVQGVLPSLEKPLAAELGLWWSAEEFLVLIAEGVLQEEGDPLGGRLGLQLMPQSDFALRVGGAHLSDRWSLGGGFAAYSEASSLSYGLHWDQSWEHVVSLGGIF